MGIVQNLSVLALRGTVEGALQATGLVGERTVENITRFLAQHFTDHSQSLSKAMQRASDKAWKALEIALAGETLWNLFDSADQKAFRRQVRTFLESTPLGDLSSHGDEFCQKCLKELRQVRKQGLLTDAPEPLHLAEQVGGFARFNDPQGILEAEWKLVLRMADDCEQAGFPTLAYLMRLQDTTNQPPLLVVAVRFFFRREIETDQELFQGLALEKIEILQAGQEKFFLALHEVITSHGDRLEVLLDSVQGKIEETYSTVVNIREEIAGLAQRLDLLHREVRPRDSLSITDETERRLVKKIIAKYRDLPEAQRRQFPDLLNDIGKLEIATGAFAEAERDFEAAADLSHNRDEQAEAHFNRYNAALEHGDWPTALDALTRAAELDARKYEPFPLRKFEPERILGAGGFGVAFLCRNRLLNSQVVVKSLRSDTLDRNVEDVFREAKVLEELDHSAIIRLRDCDYADDEETRPYIVMDYFDGQTLEEYIDKNGTLSPDELLSLLRPVAEALRAAHASNILHRDVKPGNLLVQKDETGGWRVKVIDFGLALKQNVLQNTAYGAPVNTRTVTGYSIAGTIDYAAPEQLGKLPGVSPGPSTDIYGLARTSCYALFKTVQPLRKHWREIPDDLADFLDQCLCEDPAERIQNFSAVLNCLDSLAGPADNVAALSITATKEKIPEPEPIAPEPKRSTNRSDWWRTPAGAVLEPVHHLTGHSDAVLSVAFSPRGDHLISGSADHTLRIWNVDTGECGREFLGHTDKVWNVFFLPAAHTIVSASKDKSVRLWEVGQDMARRTFPSKTNRSLAVSPDGQYALTGNVSDGMIRVWELYTGRELRRLKGHMSWVLSIAFAPNGRQAVSGSADGTVRLWDVHSGRELHCLKGHTDQVWFVAVSPDSQQALSCSADCTMRLWDLRRGKELHCFDTFGGQVRCAAFSPDGHQVLAGSDDGTIRLWDLDTFRELAAPLGHTGKVFCVAFSPDGRLAASAGLDKTIVLWRLNGMGR